MRARAASADILQPLAELPALQRAITLGQDGTVPSDPVEAAAYLMGDGVFGRPARAYFYSNARVLGSLGRIPKVLITTRRAWAGVVVQRAMDGWVGRQAGTLSTREEVITFVEGIFCAYIDCTTGVRLFGGDMPRASRRAGLVAAMATDAVAMFAPGSPAGATAPPMHAGRPGDIGVRRDVEAAIRAIEELLWLVWEPEERREVGVARVAGAVAVAPLLARATHTELQLTSGAASMFAEGFSVSDVVRMIEYCACQVQLGGWELRTVPGGGEGCSWRRELQRMCDDAQLQGFEIQRLVAQLVRIGAQAPAALTQTTTTHTTTPGGGEGLPSWPGG